MFLRRLVILTFAESFATILMERGVYFYTSERLGFTAVHNLWLALTIGVSMTAGALSSHAIARRFGERRMLVVYLLAQAGVHGWLATGADARAVFLGAAALSALAGLKWAIIESYVAAGRHAKDAARAVGWFNLGWSTAVPLALAAAGPIIHHIPAGLFVLGASIHVFDLHHLFWMAPRPTHLPDDHPERPDTTALVRLRSLLRASRILMVSSYAGLWIIAALAPDVFGRLGLSVSWAAACAGLLDVGRVSSFFLLQRYHGWHGRTGLLGAGAGMMVVGFFTVLLSPWLAVTLAGELVFGVASGVVYYASLYYAMVVKNASVDAGGEHEGLIGLGFTVGPLVGLAGRQLAMTFASEPLGYLATVGVMFAAAGTAAVLALRSGRRALAVSRESPESSRNRG